MNRLQAWLLPLHVTLLALVIPDVSRWLPLQSLLRLFTPYGSGWPYAGMSSDQVVGVIERRLRNPWRMRGRRCLRFGLLSFYFLRRAGIPAVLHFGVYVNQETRDQAHCWLTLDGRILADPPRGPHVLVLTHGEDRPFPSSSCPRRGAKDTADFSGARLSLPDEVGCLFDER